MRVYKCASDLNQLPNTRSQVFRRVEFHFGTALRLEKVGAARVFR